MVVAARVIAISPIEVSTSKSLERECENVVPAMK